MWHARDLRWWFLCIPALIWLGAPAASAYHKIIVIDRSGSMKEKDPGSKLSRYDQAKKLILEELALDLASRQNQVTLLFFDHKVRAVTQIESVPEARRLLERFKPEGGTNIGDTLAFVLNQIHNLPQERYWVVSLYTDGEESLSDPSKQKVSMAEAEQALTRYFKQRKSRMFLSVYHHQWNSKGNRDFSRILQRIQDSTRKNDKVVISLEENADPSRRSRFLDLSLALEPAKRILERPRQEGEPGQVDFTLSYHAMKEAAKQGLVFKLTPEVKGLPGVKLKLEPSRLKIDRTTGSLPVKLWVSGLGQFTKLHTYELEIHAKLQKSQIDQLLVRKLEQKEVILRVLPDRLYSKLVLAPAALFTLVQPIGAQIRDSLKVGPTHYHDVRLAWNQTAIGEEVTWKSTGKLSGAVKLIDAQSGLQRRQIPQTFKLSSVREMKLRLAVRLDGTGNLDGALVFEGLGKLKGLQEKVTLAVTEERGTLQALFPRTRPRKVFDGLPVVVPGAIQLKPDRLAVDEEYVVKTESPVGIQVEVLDDFNRVVNGLPLTIGSRQGFELGLRLVLTQPVDPKLLDPQTVRIHITPVNGSRLKVVGADEKPSARGYPLSFSLISPVKEFIVQLDPVRLHLLRGAGGKVKLRIGWTADANRTPFTLSLTPSLAGPDGGTPKKGLSWNWVDGGTEPIALQLGGKQGQRTATRELALSAEELGDWRLQILAAGLGKKQEIALPLQVVTGEADVQYVPLRNTKLPAGVFAPHGTLHISRRNQYAAGQQVRIKLGTQPGVKLRLTESGSGRQLDPDQPIELTRSDQQIAVELEYTYAVLAAGHVFREKNLLRVTPAGPGLRLSNTGRQTVAQFQLSWKMVRPKLTHYTGKILSKDISLDLAASHHFTLAPVMAKSVMKKLLAEQVTLSHKEWKRSNTIKQVVFEATGKTTASVEQLLKNGRFQVKFKDGTSHPWVAQTPVYAELTLATRAPIELGNPNLQIKKILPPRLKPPLLIGGLLALLFVIGVLFKLRSGRRQPPQATQMNVGAAGEREEVDLSPSPRAQPAGEGAISLEERQPPAQVPSLPAAEAQDDPDDEGGITL